MQRVGDFEVRHVTLPSICDHPILERPYLIQRAFGAAVNDQGRREVVEQAAGIGDGERAGSREPGDIQGLVRANSSGREPRRAPVMYPREKS